MAFTVRIDEEKQHKLDMLAATMDRSRNWLVNEAIDEYLAEQEWHIEQIQLSLEAADRGEFIPEEKILAIVNKYKPHTS